MNQTEYINVIDEVIAKGKYKPAWESLSNYDMPEWYRRAKLGIFVHWGVYSVPAFGSEWYSRNMYIQGSKRMSTTSQSTAHRANSATRTSYRCLRARISTQMPG